MGNQVTHAEDGGGATADLHCVRCGYHLRGLAEDGTCPECGTAVARSMRGDLLSAADPAWLRRIYRGHLYIVIGCAVFLLNIPLYWMSGTLMPTYFFKVSEVVVPLLFLGIVLVGVILVTTLDPRLSLTEQPVGLRRITRGAAIGALGVQSLRYAMECSSGTATGFVSLFSSALPWGGRVLLVFTVVAVTFYFSRLAERMPDRTLARRIWVTARNAGICFALFFGMRVIDAKVTIFDEFITLGCFDGILSLAAFVYMFVLIGTWWSFRKNFKRYLAEAQRREAPGERRRYMSEIDPSHKDRALGFLFLALLWVVTVILLWCLPYPHKVEGVLDSTQFGLLRWAEVDASTRQKEIHPVGLTATITMFVVATAWIMFAGGRIWRNTALRWKCRNCGYCGYNVLKGFPDLGCPECGELLPNLRKSPWAFWR
ncbi:MAG: hypothetical protein IH830_02600 [Planctomycetes bacterium]|nr:hypothetical protein [Planctomycetota bacterium]